MPRVPRTTYLTSLRPLAARSWPVAALTVVMASAAPGRLAGQLRSETIPTRALAIDVNMFGVAGNARMAMLDVGQLFYLRATDNRIQLRQTFRMIRTSDNGEQTFERYRADVRFDVRVARVGFLFGLVQWERDPNEGLRQRFGQMIGYSYEWIMASEDIVFFDVGLSAFQQTGVVDGSGPLDGNTYGVRFRGLFRHTFTKNVSYTQLLDVMPSFRQLSAYRINVESEVTAPVSDRINVRFSHSVRFTNRPGRRANGEPLDKSDRYFTAGLQFWL